MATKYDRTKKLVLVEDRHPWEKQPRETIKQFEAFQIYRDGLYQRSLAHVAATLGKSEGLIGAWSSKNNWVERADAYVDHLDHQMRAGRETQMEQDRRENAERARLIERMAGGRLIGDDDLAVVGIDWNQLDASEALAAWQAATRIRRLETGQATDVTQALNHVSKAEAVDMLQGLYETMERFVPEEFRPRMAAAVQVFFQTGKAA